MRGFLAGLAPSPVFTALILLAMTVHLIAYERGRDQAALDFAITVGGIIYLGWIAAYMHRSAGAAERRLVGHARILRSSGWRTPALI